MKITLTGKIKLFFIFTIFFMAGLSSCRTARKLPAERLKPLPAEKLLSLVENNTFDYNDITIRRIHVQFSDDATKTSFRASLKARKNRSILASISKINIPVGRVLLTPDSVTYVNYIDKNFFVDDYSFLSDFFRFSLDFETIQAILSNRLFFVGQNTRNQAVRKFDSFVEDGRYVLQTAARQNHLSSGGLLTRMRSSITPGKTTHDDQEQGVFQKMYFNRRTFSMERIVIDDGNNNRKLEVDFSDFVRLEKKNYPGMIEIKMTSPDEVADLKIKLNGFSTGKIESVDLNIPRSYNQVYVRH